MWAGDAGVNYHEKLNRFISTHKLAARKGKCILRNPILLDLNSVQSFLNKRKIFRSREFLID